MPNIPIFRLLRLITVSASARIVMSRFGVRRLWTTSVPRWNSGVTPSSMSVTQIPTLASSSSKSLWLARLVSMFASISPPSIEANALGSGSAYFTSLPFPTSWGRWPRRSAAGPDGGVELSVFVRPLDRDPRRAFGHLLRRLGIAHDGRQIALQLELALQHALGRVQLFCRHLLPARVGSGEHEVALLRVRSRAPRAAARRAVEQVHDDTPRLGEFPVRLRFHDEAHGPLPALGRRLVDARRVDLVLELLGPFAGESLDRHLDLLCKGKAPARTLPSPRNLRR